MNLREKIDYFHRDQKFYDEFLKKEKSYHKLIQSINNDEYRYYLSYLDEINNRMNLLFHDLESSYFDNISERFIHEIDRISEYLERIQKKDYDLIDNEKNDILMIIDRFMNLFNRYDNHYFDIHIDYNYFFNEKSDNQLELIFKYYEIEFDNIHNYINKFHDEFKKLNLYDYENIHKIENILFQIFLYFNIYFY